MKRKPQGGTLAAILMALGMATMAAPVEAKVNTDQSNNQTSKRDGVIEPVKQVKPESIRNQFGGFSNITHKASIDLNQRQYRKRMRQCPWLRSSKKFRGKN